MRLALGLLFLSSAPARIWAQHAAPGPTRVHGYVQDADTNEPIPGAHVFYAGTTVGHSSDRAGYFDLPLPPVASIELVVSMLGYDTHSERFDIALYTGTELEIRLTPTVLGLGEVVVTDERDEDWRENVDRFSRVFFSSTDFGKSCRIRNPEVLDLAFDKVSGELNVVAALPLAIENRDLGYLVTIHGLSMTSNLSWYFWEGSLQFDELEPKDDDQRNSWLKNRREAYDGSLRHFLALLAAGELASSEFDVYDVPNPGDYSATRPVLESIDPVSEHALYNSMQESLPPIRVDGTREGTFLFQFPASLLLKYRGDNEPPAYDNAMGISFSRRRMLREMGNEQLSWLSLRAPFVTIDMNGNILLDGPGYPIQIHGYLSWERAGELLPFDYDPEIE